MTEMQKSLSKKSMLTAILLLFAACSQPLGLTTNAIEDWQLAASSRRSSDPHCAVKHARLHRRGSRAWCPQNKVQINCRSRGAHHIQKL